ncbi:MAG: exodeoxyribonuclease VII small subunit [Oscillospiraceae bacterium]|nr:exodeoxyribonuclease VII small subunit [Oscillospiraceae bacterium]
MPKLTFEQKMAKLEEIVVTLEEGNLPLDQTLELYAKGATLSEELDKELTSAELKIRDIIIETGKRISAEYEMRNRENIDEL